MYRHFFKRFFDIFISFIGLLMLLPIFIILAILIYREDSGPIFFIQQRIGRYNVPFYIYKFRSMRIEAPHDCATEKLDNHDKNGLQKLEGGYGKTVWMNCCNLSILSKVI
jgi:O-antigen biosynthesis protein WbqP